jgi:hypothetical protein
MKNISKLVVAALALSSSAWIATAQPSDTALPDGPPPGGPGMRHHRPGPAFLKALDANTNGVIEAEEIAKATTALKALDTNGDGQLSLEEALGPRPPRPDGAPPVQAGGTNGPPVPPILAALDANHDGVIDADELANAPAALKTLDRNGDGQLTPDEFMGPRRGHGGPRGGGPGGFGGPPPGDGPPPSDTRAQQQ